MHGNTETGGRNRTRRRTYVCPNHTAKRNKSCSTKSVNAEYMESAIKAAITNRINAYLQSEKSASIFDSLTEDIRKQITALTKRIMELETKITSFVNLSARSSSELMIARYEAQAQECIACQTDKRKEIEGLNLVLSRIDTVRQQFSAYSECLTSEEIFTSNSITREIIRLFVKKIEVDDLSGEIIIDLN